MRLLRKSILWIAATLLSLGLTFVFYTVLNVNVFEYISSQDTEADVVNLFYRIRNDASSLRAMSRERDVVIFDLAGETSRCRIAAALSRLGELDPRCLVLDVIFPEASTVPAFESDSLARVMACIRDRTVVACRVGLCGEVEHSFFTQPLGLAYGAANNDRVHWHSEFALSDGTTIPSLAWLAAGKPILHDSDRYVDFSNRMFEIFSLRDELLLDRADIENRIVVVGDLGDWRDFKDLSFPIGGRQRVAGTQILAHTISGVSGNRWVRRSSDTVAWCVAALLTLLFTAFSDMITSRFRPVSLGSLFIRMLKFLIIVILLFVSYLIFARFGVIVNLVYAMLSIAMSGFTLDLIDWLRCCFVGINENHQTSRT